MLFPPFRYQSALAQTQVSLFPCSHADGFTEKSSQKFLLKHRFEDCLCTTQNCHMHFFFQLLSHFPAFKNYHLPTHEHLNILLKLFASDRVNVGSTMVLSMDSQEVPSRKSYISHDVSFYFSVFPNSSFRSCRITK